MPDRDRTFSFSTLSPSILEEEGRRRIGAQILSVLEHHLQTNGLGDRRVLDVGCSSGIITSMLAAAARSAVGIDVDGRAIDIARRTHDSGRVTFEQMSADRLAYPDASFDIVVCNQVYYWFEDPAPMMAEIRRVLAPGGVCFFATVNKYKPWEAQYRLPLLPILPRTLADWLVRATGRGDRFACHYLSAAELTRLCAGFTIHRYTPRILKDPAAYRFSKLSGVGWVTGRLPLRVLQRLEPLSPNIIWVLEKPNAS